MSLFRLALVCLLAGIFALPMPVRAQEDQTLSPKQADAVRHVVHDYLMEHPEVIQEAIEALREKMRQQTEADARKNIETYRAELFDNKDDPVTGNAKGDVTIVEFFDYNCAYCKATYDGLMETIKNDGKVRLVFKELPILTEESGIAAKVALVARKQGKYDDMHRAFMKFRGRLDEKAIFRLAGEVGLNVDQLKKDITAPELDKMIRRNKEIANALGIDGTPSFIFGDRIVSQALEAATVKQLIDVTRKNPKGDKQPG